MPVDGFFVSDLEDFNEALDLFIAEHGSTAAGALLSRRHDSKSCLQGVEQRDIPDNPEVLP